MKLNAPRVAYISLILICFSVPLIHDVIPYYAEYGPNDWLAIAGIYFVGVVLSIPLLRFAFNKDVQSSRSGKSPYLRLLLCFTLLFLCIGYFWEDSKALYISLPLLIVGMFGIMTIGRGKLFKSAYVCKDLNTGDLYHVSQGRARKLTDAESSSFRSSMSASSIPLINIDAVPVSSGSSGLDSELVFNPASGLPMYGGRSGLDVGGNTWGNTSIDPGVSINPTSGISMNGGMSGIDVTGNSWGTTSSDPTGGHNSYDPNRGY